ncbi:hypothetical protein [Thiohalocapsa sp.]|uniref:hypothetical protein n=1 Tax=Thiohalocapsa sp. TaxID=2497641 RepID=UPI0025F8C648|nr:hypothetical protein [Thiohalocapsa sp.]
MLKGLIGMGSPVVCCGAAIGRIYAWKRECPAELPYTKIGLHQIRCKTDLMECQWDQSMRAVVGSPVEGNDCFDAEAGGRPRPHTRLPVLVLEETWGDLLLLFQEAVRAGQVAAARDLLDATEAGERWRPLREALAAAAEGSVDYLRLVAPEVRTPAQAIFARQTDAASSR